MSRSLVSICNQALDLLGADPITSLDDDTEAARVCKRNLAGCIDAVLRAYPWNPAMKRASLAASPTPPSWGYTFAYPLPVDHLRLWAIEGEDDGGLDYRIEDGTILTDAGSPLNILYIARITDPNKFDPMLSEAIAAKMSSVIAFKLTGSSSRSEALSVLYRQRLRFAREIDASETRTARIVTHDWIEERI